MESILNILQDGTKIWKNLNGVPHREDGPAYEDSDGTKEWYINGQLHRVDGPAIEYPNGDKSWFQYGERHREDGPAIQWADGHNEYWLNGKKVSENIIIYLTLQKNKINYLNKNLYINSIKGLFNRN